MKEKHQSKQQQISTETDSVVVKEVAKYFDDLPYEENCELDPVIDFWPKNFDQYPLLAALATDVLIIPATSAPIERVFSQASIALGCKRVRLTGNNLEREVMLKCNRRFF